MTIKYTPDHEWLQIDADGTATVGITHHAQDALGDVVYVPTPQIVVDSMLDMAKVSKGDYLIDLGSGDDVFNVQGTSAVTNLNLHDGDERVYVSSTAAFDLGTDTDFHDAPRRSAPVTGLSLLGRLSSSWPR